jgi:hypothetical protein
LTPYGPIAGVGVKKQSVVVGLRERSAAGATAAELLRWLRESSSAAGFRRILLLHHAFEIPLDDLRPLEGWSGWNPAGALTDAEAEALLTPRSNRPAGWPGSERRFESFVDERPYELFGYTGSHAHVVLRSVGGGRTRYFHATTPRLMRMHTRYDRMEITAAGGAERQALEDFADLAEPYDTRYHYLTLPGDDFVVSWAAFTWEDGERYTPEPKTFRPPVTWASKDAVLPLAVDDGLWMKAITPDHRMVLNRMFFHDVQEFQVGAGHMRPSAIVDAGPQGNFRRYELIGDERPYYVVAAALQVPADD